MNNARNFSMKRQTYYRKCTINNFESTAFVYVNNVIGNAEFKPAVYEIRDFSIARI